MIATDRSAAAVASARATMLANGLDVEVVRDDGPREPARRQRSTSCVLNPPFHAGAAVTTGIAHELFADAARVLRPGGELWTVWNSHLDYRPALERDRGPDAAARAQREVHGDGVRAALRLPLADTANSL